MEELNGPRANEVIYGYEKFIGSLPSSMLNYIWDTDALPFPKEEILTILGNAIMISTSDEDVEFYKDLALLLPLFQENVGSTPIRLLGNFEKWKEFGEVIEKDLYENIVWKIGIAEDLRERES